MNFEQIRSIILTFTPAIDTRYSISALRDEPDIQTCLQRHRAFAVVRTVDHRHAVAQLSTGTLLGKESHMDWVNKTWPVVCVHLACSTQLETGRSPAHLLFKYSPVVAVGVYCSTHASPIANVFAFPLKSSLKCAAKSSCKCMSLCCCESYLLST